MKKILFLTIFYSGFLYSNTISVGDDKCITKKELMVILKNMFPENKNINLETKDNKLEMDKDFFDKYSSEAIVKKLKYYNKKSNDVEVIRRCDYLMKYRKLKRDVEIDLLGLCSDYKIKNYDYDIAIKYLEKQLDMNDGTLNVRGVIKKLIYLYEKKEHREKVRYLKNIIND